MVEVDKRTASNGATGNIMFLRKSNVFRSVWFLGLIVGLGSGVFASPSARGRGRKKSRRSRKKTSTRKAPSTRRAAKSRKTRRSRRCRAGWHRTKRGTCVRDTCPLGWIRGRKLRCHKRRRCPRGFKKKGRICIPRKCGRRYKRDKRGRCVPHRSLQCGAGAFRNPAGVCLRIPSKRIARLLAPLKPARKKARRKTKKRVARKGNKARRKKRKRSQRSKKRKRGKKLASRR